MEIQKNLEQCPTDSKRHDCAHRPLYPAKLSVIIEKKKKKIHNKKG